jgi:hypothetical protein
MGSLHDGGRVSHSVSFLLGALLPTLLLFFLASDRVGEQLSSISSLANRSVNQLSSHANLSTDNSSAVEKVRTVRAVLICISVAED